MKWLGLFMGLFVTVVHASASAQRWAIRDVVASTHLARDAALDPATGKLLIATEGGLVVVDPESLQIGEIVRDGLYGVRLVSVSVTRVGVWLGGVEGASLLRARSDGRYEVVRNAGLRRARKFADFGEKTWVGTYGDGLYTLSEDAAPARVRLGANAGAGRITDLLVAKGQLWIATHGGGVIVMDRQARVRTRIREEDGLGSNFVSDLEFDERSNRVLAATLSGVFDVTARNIERVASVSDAHRVVTTPHGLYFATYARGVIDSAGTRVSEIESVRNIGSFKDGLWIAHERGFDLRIGNVPRILSVLAGAESSSDITAMTRAFGTLWVGTFEDGLAQVRDGRIEGVPWRTWGIDRRVNHLAATAHAGVETLWIATDRGLYASNGNSARTVVVPGLDRTTHVTSLLAHRDDLWLTSGRALCRHRPSVNEVWKCWTRPANEFFSQLHSVAIDDSQGVWVGGVHGLFRFDPETENLERFSVATGALPVDWVTSLVALPNGRGILAGTYHGGLVWHEEGRFLRETERDGLPNGWINPHAVTRLRDQYFLGTLEGGLLVGTRGHWQRIGPEDGLPSSDVTGIFLTSDDREAWIATRGGLARIVRE